MINFILLNLIVIFTVSLLVRKIFYSSNFSDRICNFSILFLAQVVLSELILGIFNILFLKNLILFNLAILLLVWLFLRNRETKGKFSVRGGSFSWVIENKTILFCSSVILGFLVVKGFYNLINPPFGWDSLNYHFTFPVEWLKHGNLYNPPTITDDPTPTYYPINNCLFYFWLLAPFKNVFIADLGQIPFLLLSLLACFAIARKVGLSREFSFYAAGLFVIIPNFFKEIEVGYADIMVAGLFLATLNALFILNDKFNLRNLIFSGVSLGLFFGTKTLSLAYSLPLILFFAYILFKYSKGL